jgi:hypothetical protein
MDDPRLGDGPMIASTDLPIADDRRMTIASGISSHIFENELLIFSEGSQTLYSLNDSAAFIWCCCEDGMTLHELAEAVSNTYGIGIEQARSDAQHLIREWMSLQLIDHGSFDGKSPVVAKRERESAPDTCLSGLYAPNEFSSTFAFKLGGSGFLLRFSHEEHKKQVAPIFMHLKCSCDGPPVTIDIVEADNRYLVVRGNTVVAQCSLPEQIAPAVGYEVATSAYRNADFFLALHAAAVGTESGCVVFPGKCGAGKTTLVAALIKAGFRCYGDEVTMLDRVTHRIIPMPTSLRVKEGSWEIVSGMFPEFRSNASHILKDGMRLKYLVPPKGTFAVSSDDTGTIRHLVFPRYAPEGETAIRPLHRIEALRRIQQSGYAISAAWDRTKVANLLEWIKNVDCYEMEVNSLPQAVCLVRRLLD